MADRFGATSRIRLVPPLIRTLEMKIVDLKETLIRIKKEKMHAVDSVPKAIKRILNLLQAVSNKKLNIEIFYTSTHYMTSSILDHSTE